MRIFAGARACNFAATQHARASQCSARESPGSVAVSACDTPGDSHPCEARAPELLAGWASSVHAWHQGCVEASHRPEHCFVCGIVPPTQTGVLVDKSPVPSGVSEPQRASRLRATSRTRRRVVRRERGQRLKVWGSAGGVVFAFFWREILSRRGWGRGAEGKRRADPPAIPFGAGRRKTRSKVPALPRAASTVAASWLRAAFDGGERKKKMEWRQLMRRTSSIYLPRPKKDVDHCI